MKLPHAIDRTVLIRARRATVFSFFTDSERFASWWGPGSAIEARPGGAVRICYPGNTIASGTVLEIEPGARIAFTYGYEGDNARIAPGASRVSIELRDDPDGTLVVFQHELADAAVREQHVQGWRYQLSVFAHVASQREHAGAERLVDAWFAAWNEVDGARRGAALAGACTIDVSYRDQWSALQGLDELSPHIGAAQQFLPGVQTRRRGPARHCQGTVLADWQMQKGSEVLATGTNVFELSPEGRIAGAVGVAAPPATAS